MHWTETTPGRTTGILCLRLRRVRASHCGYSVAVDGQTDESGLRAVPVDELANAILLLGKERSISARGIIHMVKN
jgi:hypothetical protein